MKTKPATALALLAVALLIAPAGCMNESPSATDTNRELIATGIKEATTRVIGETQAAYELLSEQMTESDKKHDADRSSVRKATIGFQVALHRIESRQLNLERELAKLSASANTRPVCDCAASKSEPATKILPPAPAPPVCQPDAKPAKPATKTPASARPCRKCRRCSLDLPSPSPVMLALASTDLATSTQQPFGNGRPLQNLLERGRRASPFILWPFYPPGYFRGNCQPPGQSPQSQPRPA